MFVLSNFRTTIEDISSQISSIEKVLEEKSRVLEKEVDYDLTKPTVFPKGSPETQSDVIVIDKSQFGMCSALVPEYLFIRLDFLQSLDINLYLSSFFRPLFLVLCKLQLSYWFIWWVYLHFIHFLCFLFFSC